MNSMKSRPRHICIALSAMLLALSASAQAAEEKDADRKAEKTRDVKLKDITLALPESWKQGPENNLRLGTFVVPKAEGDPENAELVVSSFPGGGGGVRQNLPRWQGEFAPDGLEREIRQGKSKQGEYVIADFKGTHLGPGFRRRAEPLEDGQLLVVVLTTEKDVYFLKLTGPEKTVSAAAAALRASFGGSAKEEKPYESEG